MAETDLTPEEAASDARLPQYNTGAYDPVTNEFGFDEDGHQVNQMRQARDAGVMGRVARRLALFTQGLANTVAANVLLTAEDARNTRLDRIAAAENVVLAADEVGKAKVEVTKAAAQAEALIGTSNSVNAPGAGNRVFQTQPGKQFRTGGYVSIVNPNVLRWMFGRVNSYNVATGVLSVDVEDFGPLTEAVQPWTIQVSGARGAKGDQGIPGIATMPYRARSSNTQLVAGDSASLIDATGTFTQTFAAPAALGANWYCFYKNAGIGNITIPASDGRTNWIMYPGEMRLFQCDGATLRSEVLSPFSIVFLANGNFIKPPGYSWFEIDLLSGAGGGGRGGNGQNVIGAGGGSGTSGVLYPSIAVRSSPLPDAVPISIGAGGAPGSAGSGGSAGGSGGATSFGDVGTGSAIGNVGTVGADASGTTVGGSRPLPLEPNSALTSHAFGLDGVAGLRSNTSNSSAPIFEAAQRIFGLTHRGGMGESGFNNASPTPAPGTSGSSGAVRVSGVL